MKNQFRLFPSPFSSITVSSFFRSNNFPLFVCFWWWDGWSWSGFSAGSGRIPPCRWYPQKRLKLWRPAIDSLLQTLRENLDDCCLVYGEKCTNFGFSSHLVWRRDRERSVRSNWLVMPIKIIRESGSDGHSKIRYKTLCYLLTSWSISFRTSIIILCFFYIKKFSKKAIKSFSVVPWLGFILNFEQIFL